MFKREILGDVNPFIAWCFDNTSDSGCTPPGTAYNPKRKAKQYELELIIWSDNGYMIIDENKYELQRGDLIFRKPGMTILEVAPYRSYSILFCMIHADNNFLIDPINQPLEKEVYIDEVCKGFKEISKNNINFPFDFPLIMKVSQISEFEELFHNIYKERTLEREQSHIFSKSYLLQIFALMYSELSTTSLQQHRLRSIRSNHQKILEVKNYIDNNIKLKFKLEYLADLAGLSPNYFCKMFKEIVGYPPIEYIIKGKVSAIKNVLVSSNKDIKEIYYEFGFENKGHFYYIFKKFQGLTPLDFRKMYQAPPAIKDNLK